ncbi:uncharacterized protein BO95DRAFT_24620 [Aspergillus brunneoviolaceus CBS 621.78]|uniref:Uncharacterized protein n=1 Tax=Aspergillus brunneoviolaceus CBS 621.78 TaxID=1450534 RepID=A0ACD1GIG1_9EURO|nr:hypothetical protein BO95DRAFT_24620 [Aspergillus brunneoviolaceus CBS 621.78]RAH49025.1 hypothetical protein BO95DRAFT_24620 [Aspergillus brunneoviolaceus CBS 621.78]
MQTAIRITGLTHGTEVPPYHLRQQGKEPAGPGRGLFIARQSINANQSIHNQWRRRTHPPSSLMVVLLAWNYRFEVESKWTPACWMFPVPALMEYFVSWVFRTVREISQRDDLRLTSYCTVSLGPFGDNYTEYEKPVADMSEQRDRPLFY